MGAGAKVICGGTGDSAAGRVRGGKIEGKIIFETVRGESLYPFYPARDLFRGKGHAAKEPREEAMKNAKDFIINRIDERPRDVRHGLSSRAGKGKREGIVLNNDTKLPRKRWEGGEGGGSSLTTLPERKIGSCEESKEIRS